MRTLPHVPPRPPARGFTFTHLMIVLAFLALVIVSIAASMHDSIANLRHRAARRPGDDRSHALSETSRRQPPPHHGRSH